MTDCVLDASAVLAYLHDEPGAEVVSSRLRQGMISSVNLAEVVSKLVDGGASASDARSVIEGLGCEVASVDIELGLRAGSLRAETRSLGLSLGDRVCLALAEREGLPVLTADRAWEGLGIGVEVSLIR